MPPAGLEPATWPPATRAITQLTKWEDRKRPAISTDSKENDGPKLPRITAVREIKLIKMKMEVCNK